MLAIAITFNGGIHVNLVGSGKGAKSSAHQRRSRGSVGTGVHLGWTRFDLLSITVVAGYFDKDCRPSWKVSMLQISTE